MDPVWLPPCILNSETIAGVKIDYDGIGKVILNGTCTITATCGSKSATCNVTVAIPIPCTGITLDKSSLSFDEIGESQILAATVTPSNTTDTVTWSSNKTSVATVNNGVVTSRGEGSCAITAICGSKSVTCNVIVDVPVTTYSISNDLTNVTNSNKTTSIVEGNSYYAELECASNYKIVSVAVFMDNVDITNSVYTPIEDENIAIYSITNDLTNVTNNNKTTSIAEGSSYHAELECADNHKIVSVIIDMDGEDITDGVYTPVEDE